MFLRNNSFVIFVAILGILHVSNLGSVLVRADEDQPPPNAGESYEEPDISRPEANNAESGQVLPDLDEDDQGLKPSPYAETTLVFVEPPAATELPGGKEVMVIVGLLNKGEIDLIVDRIEAAFHYPLDYSYFIQNFTTVQYGNRLVPSNSDASFDYMFVPSDMLSSRTFGLSICIFYNDADGNSYRSAAHNSTINIYEPDDGFDSETFFLYATLTAFAILGAVGGYHYIVTLGLRKLKSVTSKSRVAVETGTQGNKADIDYDWLPESTLESINKQKQGSPKIRTSPRLRAGAAKRRSGDD